MYCDIMFFFFFKQKTAYEMRISDWSSDVCSSDLGVVGRFVEFYGPGVGALSLADRATIANMAPEYGATCGFFPIDDQTLDYMRPTGRSEEHLALTEAYAKEQGFWLDTAAAHPLLTDALDLDMGTGPPSLPRPHPPPEK